MNKKEAIKTAEFRVIYPTEVQPSLEVLPLEEVKNIISQIDETQKVVVPKFVAEWIEETKNICLLDAMSCSPSKIKNWLYEDGNNNEETFILARLYGYEIEQEKLYTVEIPDPNSYYRYRYLSRNDNGVCIDASSDAKWKQKRKNHFTESEIKQDFEWAFQFAKPV